MRFVGQGIAPLEGYPPIDADTISESDDGQSITRSARQATLGAGLPQSAGAVTLSKMCGSGMRAMMFAHDMLKAESAEIVVAGGMESMTNAPHLTFARKGVRYGGHLGFRAFCIARPR